MKRARWMIFAPATAGMIVACSSFSGDAEPQAANDAGDAATVDAASDSTPPASLDGGGDAATVDAGPCAVDVVIAGYRDDGDAGDAGTKGAPTYATSYDAYGYDAKQTARVQCLRLFIDAGANGTPIVLGVYASNPSDNLPLARLAKSTLDGLKTGWNSAVLDVPIDLTKDQRIWIAVGSVAGPVQLRMRNGGCDDEMRSKKGTLLSPSTPQAPDPFGASTGYFNTCNALAYLSP